MAEPEAPRDSSRPSELVEKGMGRRVGAFALTVAALALTLSATPLAAPAPAPDLAAVNARLGSLAVPFEANQGPITKPPAPPGPALPPKHPSF